MGAATAGKGLGLHPAPYPHNTHLGAARWVAPNSPAAGKMLFPLPASKTQCGPRAERVSGLFKEARSLKTEGPFKGNLTVAAIPLKGWNHLKGNGPLSLKAHAFKENGPGLTAHTPVNAHTT